MLVDCFIWYFSFQELYRPPSVRRLRYFLYLMWVLSLLFFHLLRYYEMLAVLSGASGFFAFSHMAFLLNKVLPACSSPPHLLSLVGWRACAPMPFINSSWTVSATQNRFHFTSLAISWAYRQCELIFYCEIWYYSSFFQNMSSFISLCLVAACWTAWVAGENFAYLMAIVPCSISFRILSTWKCKFWNFLCGRSRGVSFLIIYLSRIYWSL